MPQALYQLFGLTLASDIPLPELLPADAGKPADVRICRAELPEAFSQVPQTPAQPSTEDRAWQFAVRDVARYRVSGGRLIEVDPMPGADEGDVRLYLLGTAIGVLLHQQGRLPLHVCAIARENEAHAFCGVSGAGKSTLAAGLHRAGFSLLCDDVGLVIPDAVGQPWLYPGMTRIKLWCDALDHLGLDPAGLTPDLTRLDKYHLTVRELEDAFHAGPLPLTRLYELQWGDPEEGVTIEPLNRDQTLALAIAHTYRPGMVRKGGFPQSHLRQCGQLANRVQGFCYRRPRDLRRFEAALRVLIDHVTSGDR